MYLYVQFAGCWQGPEAVTKLSPSKRWQNAALRAVASGGVSTPSPQVQDLAAEPLILDSHATTQEMSPAKTSSWSSLLPLLRLHRVYWKVQKQGGKKQEEILEVQN